MRNIDKLNEIKIGDNTYPLGYLFSSSSNIAYPQVMVNGTPIISIEVSGCKAEDESLKRAEVAINSFIASNEQYAYLPDEAFDGLVAKDILECLSSAIEFSIDEYCMFGIKQVVIESKQYNKHWFRFAIYDKALCEKLLLIKHMSHENGLVTTNSKMDELESIILKCSMIDLPLDSKEVNDCLREMQILIGQKYGDYASIFFNDLSDNWHEFPSEGRAKCLRSYVKDELSRLINKHLA